MRPLSKDYMEKFDYNRTKKNVESFIDLFVELYCEKSREIPNNLSSRLYEVRVDKTPTNISPQEMLLIRNETMNENFMLAFNAILHVTEEFSVEEQIAFKGIYFDGISMLDVIENIHKSEKTVRMLLRSAIIKFALAFNMAVKK